MILHTGYSTALDWACAAYGPAVMHAVLRDSSFAYALERAGGASIGETLGQAQADVAFRERLSAGQLTQDDARSYIRPAFHAFALATDPTAAPNAAIPPDPGAFRYINWICSAFIDFQRQNHDNERRLCTASLRRVRDEITAHDAALPPRQQAWQGHILPYDSCGTMEALSDLMKQITSHFMQNKTDIAIKMRSPDYSPSVLLRQSTELIRNDRRLILLAIARCSTPAEVTQMTSQTTLGPALHTDAGIVSAAIERARALAPNPANIFEILLYSHDSHRHNAALVLQAMDAIESCWKVSRAYNARLFQSYLPPALKAHPEIVARALRSCRTISHMAEVIAEAAPEALEDPQVKNLLPTPGLTQWKNRRIIRNALQHHQP